ncbi:MAG: hypothetical protein RIR76_1687 [Verrucomicrobiota bacterium]|jgi:hypothetical protein
MSVPLRAILGEPRQQRAVALYRTSKDAWGARQGHGA